MDSVVKGCMESCHLPSKAPKVPLNVTWITSGKDKQISAGFTTNRKELLSARRELSVPLEVEIVGHIEQVALQILLP